MSVELREVARGRWPEILPKLGLPVARLNGRHGPCPLCGQGKDRFRFDDKDGRGTWICNQCGAGDGISFVQQMQKVNFRGAADLIKPLIGVAKVRTIKPNAADSETRRCWLNRIWADARSIVVDDPVGKFLHARTGIVTYPPVLRYHPNLEYRLGSGRSSYHPAMLALISDENGRPANLLRTYLTSDGSKADVDQPRRFMPGCIPAGAAVRLSEVAETLGVAEGIETALAVNVLTGIPCWSAISATHLERWVPPKETRRVVIFGDNDENFVGQEASISLAKSVKDRGLAKVEVRIPQSPGDWNDVLLGGARR